MTSSEQTYTLHPYHPRFAAGMAQMWNESDHQWPGTFTRGVPFDEKRILEWMERVTAIIKFVIEEDQTGKIVGYGDLWDEGNRPGACYVALLNVHPEHQSKSLARRMLHEMVNWATENGYDKVTIGTWPANLKAMPLYKKVGFFWQPGTSVFMENYIPAVRQLPLAKAFFERHDWYRDYKRELKQIEDEMRHPKTGDTKVYTLRWEADGDLLETVFDRNGQRLTGLATNDFAAYARIGDSEPAQGVTYPVEWEVTNTSPRSMTVSLFASGDPGIEITYRATFALAPGETRLLSSTYRVAPDAPKFEVDDIEKITPRLNTLLVLDGQVVEFGSGLRYRPPVEFSLGPNGITLTPGQATPVHLQLKNRTKQPLDLTLTLTPAPTFETDWRRETVTVPAGGQAGLPLVVTPTRGGEVPLTVQASFTVEGQAITTPAKKLPLLALEPGGLAAGQDDDAIIVQNAFFHLKAKRKGGGTSVTSHALKRGAVVIVEELGPPFVPWDLEERHFDLHLAHENGAVKVTATVASGRFPGLVLTREMTITASPLITVRHRVANTGTTAHEFQ
ncbi:MAG TPA: GNAT family N-acetyltransferase, partial [Anaerolineales bacterium]|nr:GNAT family N-acetyltransferase [Anaerolineales bacterium]